nr:TetR/AcrR family transcriptional regulator C-terminal domain-containing protein [Nocardia bovistercoris]
MELVLDEFWGTLDILEPEQASWREVVTSFAHGLRHAMIAHPWSASLVGHLPSMGPNSLRLTDRLRRTFVRAGFTGIDVYLASGTVMCFVLGQVIPEIAWRTTLGGDDDARDALIEQTLELAGDYPEMVAEYRAAPPIHDATAREIAFDFGLVCALDGLAARLRQPGENYGASTESTSHHG